MRKKTQKRLLAGVLLFGLLVAGYVYFFGFNLPNVIIPQPVAALRGTVLDTPDSAPIASVPVYVYGDPQGTQLLGSS
jgi:hypothetical protein